MPLVSLVAILHPILIVFFFVLGSSGEILDFGFSLYSDLIFLSFSFSLTFRFSR